MDTGKLSQASLSNPLVSCTDLFSFSVCGDRTVWHGVLRDEVLVYRCFVPVFLGGGATLHENLQMALEMTSLCSLSHSTYVHLLCSTPCAEGPTPESSVCFYFYLSDDALSRAGICRRLRFTPSQEDCMWFVEVSHVLFRSPHGVYREYIQNQRLPIHTFAGDGHQALVCDSVPPGQSDIRLDVYQVARICRSALDAGLGTAIAQHPAKASGALSLGFDNRVVFTEERAGPFPVLLASMLHSDFGLACWIHPGLCQPYRHSFTRGSLDGYSFTVLVTPLSSDIAAPGVCLQFRHKHHGPYTGFVYRQAKYVMSLSWASTFQASDGTQRVGGAVYENESIVVAKHFERVDWSSAADRQIAFLMGSHARLGAASMLAGLDAGIMRSIVRNCRGLSLQLGAPWSWD